MTAPAAFRASYADWKLIKTRGVVSISFEVPLNESHLAYEALGGMPVAAKEIWCGIAQLDPKANQFNSVGGNQHEVTTAQSTEPTPRQDTGKHPDGAKTKTAFRDMRLPNQAGMLCAEVPFQRFLADLIHHDATLTKEQAADYVRRHCNVASRTDIRPRTESGKRWEKLAADYHLWMHGMEGWAA